MRTLKIYGSSDDLIEIEGIRGADEFSANAHSKIMGVFLVGGKMKITALYDGCWFFAIGLADEGIALPNWPIRISSHENEYSTCLEIDVPDDVAVHQLKER